MFSRMGFLPVMVMVMRHMLVGFAANPVLDCVDRLMYYGVEMVPVSFTVDVKSAGGAADDAR